MCRPTHGPASPLAPVQTINEVWTTDFKGEFLTGDGRYCYPLTLRDGCSRFVLRAMRWRGTDVPASRYQPSARRLPRHLPPLEHPGHLEIRRVSTIGQISWRNAPVFVSEPLAGEEVGFEEVNDGLWTIRFASVVLGRFDERRRRIQPIAAITTGRSASSAGSAPDHENSAHKS